MGKIYVGQSALTLKLDTEVDLATATDPRIYYLKPSGTTGYWTGTVTETTKIQYDVADTLQLDETGLWKFWSYALFATRVIYGEPTEKFVSSLLTGG